MKIYSINTLYSIIFLIVIPFSAFAQEMRKVAVFDPEGTVEKSLLEVVREEISSVVVNTTGYTVLERQLINKVLEENRFQESGLVNDEQVSDIGKRMGADYVFVTTISALGRNYYISCKMIEVSTARIDKQSTGTTTDGINDIPQTTQYIVRRLFGENVQQPVANRQSQQTDRQVQTTTPQTGATVTSRQSETVDNNRNNTKFGSIELIFVEGGIGGMKNFYIGKYEITQKQWEGIMGSNPSKYKGDNYPVDQVSYNDVLNFIYILNARTGLKFRLPTETEWLYAAKGGRNQDNYSYAGSDDPNKVAVYNTYPKGPNDVGTKQPNSLGIFDMSGNVCEWVDDRKILGGSWTGMLKLSYKAMNVPTWFSNFDTGFRIALSE